MTFKEHPGIWFTLWSFETYLLLNLLSSLTAMNQFQGLCFQLFLRIWFLTCFWWITYFHVRWLTALDEKEYYKQKGKDAKYNGI